MSYIYFAKITPTDDLPFWFQCNYIVMNIKSFFKLVNRKINKYDKAATNPFEAIPLSITLVWVEEDNEEKEEYKRYDLN